MVKETMLHCQRCTIFTPLPHPSRFQCTLANSRVAPPRSITQAMPDEDFCFYQQRKDGSIYGLPEGDWTWPLPV